MTERQLLENYAKASNILCDELYECIDRCSDCPLSYGHDMCYLSDLNTEVMKIGVDARSELDIYGLKVKAE